MTGAEPRPEKGSALVGASLATRPAGAVPPGEFVREELEARGWSQADLAATMGCAPRTVSEIIKGRRGLSAKTAVSLGAAFGTSADFWLNLETARRVSGKIGSDED